MKNLNYVLVGLIPLVFSCKKEKPKTPEVSEKPPVEASSPYLVDSISFKINGVSYVGNDNYGAGYGNSGVNTKYYDKEIPGRRSWGEIGSSYRYGEPDSIMYTVFKRFDIENGSIRITFAKKMGQNQLDAHLSLLGFADNASLYTVGNRGFATDYRVDQKLDGIVVDFYGRNFDSELSSYVPYYTIIKKIDLGSDIQKDSKFEIIKAERIGENRLLVVAKFELNLYDDSGKKYRVENGYYRFNTIIKFDNNSVGIPF